MNRLLLFLILTISTHAYSQEYEIKTIGAEYFNNTYLQVIDINDSDKITGSYSDGIYHSNTGIFYMDELNGIVLIPKPEQLRNSLEVIAINEIGEVLCQSMSVETMGDKGIFIWSLENGLKRAYLFGNNQSASCISFNNNSQIIGNLHSNNIYSCFLLENGVVKNLGIGSDLHKAISSKGYYATKIRLHDINDKSEILGTFDYSKYNAKKQQYVHVGSIPFVWNRAWLSEIIIPNNFTDVKPLKINNEGVVLITANNDYLQNRDQARVTFLYFKDNGLKLINDFSGVDINDNLTVIGINNSYKNSFCVWRNDSIELLSNLLDVENINNISPPFSDDYQVEDIQFIRKINNKGHILGEGTSWGEKIPCILVPKKHIDFFKI